MTIQTAAANADYGATASGSSFYAAMRILPRSQREAMFQIYSFCRQVDDIADSLGISYGDLRSAIDELTKIGWVNLELLSEGLVLSLPEDARVAS